MEIKNRQEGAYEDLCSLSEVISSFSSVDQNEVNPLQEIFEDHSSSEKETNTNDHSNNDNVPWMIITQVPKRQRSMDYHLTMEKKKRQIFKDKLDILMRLIPIIPKKSDIASKLEIVMEYIKSLQHQCEVMVMEYIACTGYAPPFYGAQAPCMSPSTTPWDYYAPGVPMMPQQDMPFTPQFHQAHGTAPPRSN